MGFFETEDKVQEQRNKQATHSLWVEKYRPNTMEEFVGNENLKSKVTQYIKTGDVPHLLLYGPAGSGKTTAAKMIGNSIDADVLILNASDENSVETVRSKVKGFASTVGFASTKLVILDEADYLSPNAQAILRNLMETFSNTCRFILTCNYVERIISPVQSRCQTFQVIPPVKKDIAIHLDKILKKEGVQYEPKDLVKIIETSYPDIRKIINTVQLSNVDGKLTLDSSALVETGLKERIVNILASSSPSTKKYTEIRQLLLDNRTSDYTEFYTYLFEHVDEYAGSNTSLVVLVISESVIGETNVVDKEIVFMATIIKILQII